nr:hypothetical protein CFP56_76740 [Quercus suber]
MRKLSIYFRYLIRQGTHEQDDLVASARGDISEPATSFPVYSSCDASVDMHLRTIVLQLSRVRASDISCQLENYPAKEDWPRGIRPDRD